MVLLHTNVYAVFSKVYIALLSEAVFVVVKEVPVANHLADLRLKFTLN